MPGWERGVILFNELLDLSKLWDHLLQNHDPVVSDDASTVAEEGADGGITFKYDLTVASREGKQETPQDALEDLEEKVFDRPGSHERQGEGSLPLPTCPLVSLRALKGQASTKARVSYLSLPPPVNRAP